MLYEQLFDFLSKLIHRRRDCNHDFIDDGYSFISYRNGYAYKRLHFKCTKCGKKEKRVDESNSYTLL
jgi:hypothetical protein